MRAIDPACGSWIARDPDCGVYGGLFQGADEAQGIG